MRVPSGDTGSSQGPARRGTDARDHRKHTATRPLRERVCLRVHRASGLHFPEFVRAAFLSGSASVYTVPGLHLPECRGKQSRGSLSRKTTGSSLTTVPKMPERKDSRQVPTSGVVRRLADSYTESQHYVSPSPPAKMFQTRLSEVEMPPIMAGVLLEREQVRRCNLQGINRVGDFLGRPVPRTGRSHSRALTRV